MKNYVYPAVFTAESGGLYSVNFPDLKNCYTCGDDLADALEMAKDVLSLTLYEYQKNKVDFPEPSDLKSIQCDNDSFVNFVSANTLAYQKKFNNKAVKKTLSIPEWLNEAASAANINFSQVLQEGLLHALDLA